MKSLLTSVAFGFVFLCSDFFVNSAYAEQAEQKEKPKRPMIPVVQKDGKKASRRCFKDANNDGYCDNGSDQQWKCKNNCRSVESIEKEQKEKQEKKEIKDGKEKEAPQANALPCGNCPKAGACHGECLAMFKMTERL